MADENTCPRCHRPLPAGPSQGVCPKCLLQRGLETNTVGYTAADPAGSAWEPPAIDTIAASFPELDILELIGRGGMGAVYKAREQRLDRLVALKILPPEIGRDAAFAQRFTHEAQAMARLNHANIVTIHSFGQRGDLYYFIMEYVDGLSLRQLLGSGRVEAKEALAIVPQICDALQYAHDRGIVHRDIKPENILLNRSGQVKIADFGLAKLVGRPGPEGVAAEKVMGTPRYMAPEQVDRPAEVDHRADIYSLGVVFYQMLTGELPGRQFEPPSHKVLIDVRLDEVVLRALERQPSRRYQQASEVKTQVETIVATAPPQTTATAANPESSRAEASQPGLADIDFSLEFGKARSGVRIKKGIVLVGNRGGKAVINWPGVMLIVGVMFAGLILLVAGFALLTGYRPGLGILVIFGMMLAGLAASILRSFRLPPDQLAPLDQPPMPQTPEIERARQAVRGPAIGLLVAAGINIAVLLVIVAIAVMSIVSPGISVDTARTRLVVEPLLLIFVIALALFLNAVVVWGAKRMMQLRNRRLCVDAAIVAMIAVPGSLIGLAMGIWALVVLGRRDVIAAFAAVRVSDESAAAGHPPSFHARLWGVLLAASIAASWLWYLLSGGEVHLATPIMLTIGGIALVLIGRRKWKALLVVVVGIPVLLGLLMAILLPTISGWLDRYRNAATQTVAQLAVKTAGFTARLPSGVTVDLVGVSENPSQGKSWWWPDGEPLAKPPYTHMGSTVTPSAKERAYEIALTLGNLPSEDTGTRWVFDPPCNSTSGGVVIGDDGKIIPGLRAIAALARPSRAREREVRPGGWAMEHAREGPARRGKFFVF